MAWKPAEFIYVGIRKSDGAMRAMCCDDEGCEEHTAEIVADWIKRGLSVERLSDADYRARLQSKCNASSTADTPSDVSEGVKS